MTVSNKKLKDLAKSTGLSLTPTEWKSVAALKGKIGASSNAAVVRLGIKCLKDNLGFSASPNVGRLGLIDVIQPANGYHYEKILAKARSLTLVFNDARNWLDGPIEDSERTKLHIKALGERAKDPKKTTVLYLHHPLNPHMQMIADVSKKDFHVQVGEIHMAIDKLKHLASPRFRVLGHPRYNTYSMILADNHAYVNYYPVAFRGEEDTGHIHHYKNTGEDTGVFYRIAKDVEKIHRASEDLKFSGIECDLFEYCKDNLAPTSSPSR